MIEIEISSEIGYLYFNSPANRNALSTQLVESAMREFNAFLRNDEIKVIVIGSRGSAFCAGADLQQLIKLRDSGILENYADAESLRMLFELIYSSPKPTIAAVSGPAIGGGFGLALACDFIIADKKSAKFCFPEVQIGFLPAIVSVIAVAKIGQNLALQLLLTGQMILPEEAFRQKIIYTLADDALNEATQLGLSLAKNSTWNIMQTKKMVLSISQSLTSASFAHSSALNTLSRRTSEFTNGVNSIINRKKQ